MSPLFGACRGRAWRSLITSNTSANCRNTVYDGPPSPSLQMVLLPRVCRAADRRARRPIVLETAEVWRRRSPTVHRTLPRMTFALRIYTSRPILTPTPPAAGRFVSDGPQNRGNYSEPLGRNDLRRKTGEIGVKKLNHWAITSYGEMEVLKDEKRAVIFTLSGRIQPLGRQRLAARNWGVSRTAWGSETIRGLHLTHTREKP